MASKYITTIIADVKVARLFLQEYSRLSRTRVEYPCCYGHFGCSTKEGGPCMDETLSNYPEADPYYP